MRTDFIVTHKQGFISGGQPPDPRCGVPCRAAAIKLSAYSAPQRLCVKTYNSTYSIGERGERAAGEVFGCIPHGARAYCERDSFTIGSDSYNSDSYNIQKEMQ